MCLRGGIISQLLYSGMCDGSRVCVCVWGGGGGGGWSSKRHAVFGVRVQNVILCYFCAIVAAAHAVADRKPEREKIRT